MFMHVVYICDFITQEAEAERTEFQDIIGSLRHKSLQACTTVLTFSQSWGSYTGLYKCWANTNQGAASPALFHNLDNKYMVICVTCISDYSLKI